MTAEKRQTYTAEFMRESVRLVLAHGYAMTDSGIGAEFGSPGGSRLGNANWRHKRTGHSQAEGVCRLTRTNSTACART